MDYTVFEKKFLSSVEKVLNVGLFENCKKNKQVKELSRLLLMYLFMISRHGPDTTKRFSPWAPKIDEAWHTIILESELYQDISQYLLGEPKLIRHAVLRSADKIKTKDQRISNTLKEMKNLFPNIDFEKKLNNILYKGLFNINDCEKRYC